MSKQDMLHIDKRLPMIKLPKDKVKVFVEWFNQDLRQIENIPEVFNEGYLEIDYSDILHIQTASIFECKSEKEVKIQSELKRVANAGYKKMILHFKSDGAGGVNFTAYSGVGECLARQSISPKQNKMIETIINMARASNPKDEKLSNEKSIVPLALSELNLDLRVNNKEEWEAKNSRFNQDIGATCSGLLTAVLWYLATTKIEKYLVTNSTLLENSISSANYQKSNHSRTIKTPIYELVDKRPVTVERLIKKRTGWTISHAFQVRGHYRHYKNGNVIFIKPFVKCKEKSDFQAPTLLIKPDEV